MNDELITKLRLWAEQYNTPSFIQSDPIQFPHRFKRKQDIEISGILTTWISYGRRSHIINKAEELHQLLGDSPYAFIMNGDQTFRIISDRISQSTGRDTFYRFYTYTDLLDFCQRLKAIYEQYDSLEDAIADVDSHDTPFLKLQYLLRNIRGIPVLDGTSACKRLAMFLRWMVRDDGIVDLGIWKTSVKPCDLIIPLDTHVHQISLRLGLTESKNATLRTAIEITESLKIAFPDDPAKGDFALFGYDIDK